MAGKIKASYPGKNLVVVSLNLPTNHMALATYTGDEFTRVISTETPVKRGK